MVPFPGPGNANKITFLIGQFVFRGGGKRGKVRDSFLRPWAVFPSSPRSRPLGKGTGVRTTTSPVRAVDRLRATTDTKVSAPPPAAATKVLGRYAHKEAWGRIFYLET